MRIEVKPKAVLADRRLPCNSADSRPITPHLQRADVRAVGHVAARQSPRTGDPAAPRL